MSPVEVMCFFFISLAVIKAVRDCIEYWNHEEADYIPVRTARVSRVPSARRGARITAIGREYEHAKRGRSA